MDDSWVMDNPDRAVEELQRLSDENETMGRAMHNDAKIVAGLRSELAQVTRKRDAYLRACKLIHRKWKWLAEADWGTLYCGGSLFEKRHCTQGLMDAVSGFSDALDRLYAVNHWLRIRLVSQEAASMLAVERMQVDGDAARQACMERDVFERAALDAVDRLAMLRDGIGAVLEHSAVMSHDVRTAIEKLAKVL